MNALWARFVSWCRNKFGRIVTSVGGISMFTDIWDPAPVKDPLNHLFGDYWGGKVLAILTFVCIGLSLVRHQQVANRVKKLEQAQAKPAEPAG